MTFSMSPKNPRSLLRLDAGIGLESHGVTPFGFSAGGGVCGSRGFRKQQSERGKRGLGNSKSSFRRITFRMPVAGGHML